MGGGASVLILTLALPRRSLDFHHVTVSRGTRAPAGPSASVRLNARLSVAVALRDRPGHTESREEIDLEVHDAYGLQRADIVRVLSVALTYVDLRSHARESENA